jgi:hypothetical protein
VRLERGYRRRHSTISGSKDLQPSEISSSWTGTSARRRRPRGGRCGRGFDRIDLIINNARTTFPKPFIDYTPDFERMIGTNIAGYFFVTQQRRAMRKQRSGHVVSISTALTVSVNRAPISLPVLASPRFRRSPRPGDGVRPTGSGQYDRQRRGHAMH